jgi:hypothetical protein
LTTAPHTTYFSHAPTLSKLQLAFNPRECSKYVVWEGDSGFKKWGIGVAAVSDTVIKNKRKKFLYMKTARILTILAGVPFSFALWVLVKDLWLWPRCLHLIRRWSTRQSQRRRQQHGTRAGTRRQYLASAWLRRCLRAVRRCFLPAASDHCQSAWYGSLSSLLRVVHIWRLPNTITLCVIS